MFDYFRGFTVRRIVLTVSGAVSFLIFLVLILICSALGKGQQSQRMAERWSEKKDTAQISCFFSVGAEVDENTIKGFEHGLDKALLEASITQESPNANARLWADAYSADGKVTMASDRASLEANAVGIGGDFFQFHPLRLLNGSYFSGNDLMQDYCVIDEDAAWQLFGSSDVAGMTVTISGIPHIVTGVVEREKGKLQEDAGLDGTVVYVSYSTLENYGMSNGLNHFEIVMPNPVSKYAFNYVKENIGIDERDVEVVENTNRYSLVERLKTIVEFGSRSMNKKAIIYPYWENIARGYEDITALLTLLALLFLLYSLILLTIAIVLWWKHKSWTIKSVYLYVKDKTERRMEKLREHRKAKREHEGKERGSKEHGPKKHDRKEDGPKRHGKKRGTAGKQVGGTVGGAEEEISEKMPGRVRGGRKAKSGRNRGKRRQESLWPDDGLDNGLDDILDLDEELGEEPVEEPYAELAGKPDGEP